jgi:hypothetical protein
MLVLVAQAHPLSRMMVPHRTLGALFLRRLVAVVLLNTEPKRRKVIAVLRLVGVQMVGVVKA